MRARFPVLFVDEYQDLGHALHELVLLLCFEGGMRLFAMGDADQSIYGFTGAAKKAERVTTMSADRFLRVYRNPSRPAVDTLCY
jgi:DNA helicase-2/ATP-dependent DNA helicase PcrA